jgi:hypothetical protein
MKPLICEQLRAWNIQFPKDMERTTKLCAFDCETWAFALTPTIGGQKLIMTDELQLICLSLANNIVGENCVETFVDLTSPQEIVDSFIFRLKKYSDINYQECLKKYGSVLDQIDKKSSEMDNKELANPFAKMKKRLLQRWRQLIVVGFKMILTFEIERTNVLHIAT